MDSFVNFPSRRCQIHPFLLSVYLSLYLLQDVLLESSNRNYKNLQYLIVGKHPGFPLKRSLVEFQNPPSSCTHIRWAKMYVYFVYAHKPSWMTVAQVPYISRPLQVHQVNSDTIISITLILYLFIILGEKAVVRVRGNFNSTSQWSNLESAMASS